MTLPAGVEDGATRTVRGYGDTASGATAAGDLDLNIRIAEHPLFSRQGADLLCTVPVSFPQAALGAMIEVPTLDGEGQDAPPVGHATRPPAFGSCGGKGMPQFLLWAMVQATRS